MSSLLMEEQSEEGLLMGEESFKTARKECELIIMLFAILLHGLLFTRLQSDPCWLRERETQPVWSLNEKALVEEVKLAVRDSVCTPWPRSVCPRRSGVAAALTPAVRRALAARALGMAGAEDRQAQRHCLFLSSIRALLLIFFLFYFFGHGLQPGQRSRQVSKGPCTAPRRDLPENSGCSGVASGEAPAAGVPSSAFSLALGGSELVIGQYPQETSFKIKHEAFLVKGSFHSFGGLPQGWTE